MKFSFCENSYSYPIWKPNQGFWKTKPENLYITRLQINFSWVNLFVIFKKKWLDYLHDSRDADGSQVQGIDGFDLHADRKRDAAATLRDLKHVQELWNKSYKYTDRLFNLFHAFSMAT